MQITRIFRGRKEYASKYYYVGQRFIDCGRLKGTYETVTRDCDTYDEAATEMARKGYGCLPSWQK